MGVLKRANSTGGARRIRSNRDRAWMGIVGPLKEERTR